MDNSEIITGKMARTLKSTSMVARTSMKHMRYLTAKRKAKDLDELTQKHEEEIGKLLFKGLSQMRGTALKASQLLSLEADLIPERIRKELAKSCYQVPPINKALIRKVFLQEFDQTPSQLFRTFEQEAFAAASLGQVHMAQVEGSSSELIDVAVKVQYPGVSVSIESDLKILSVLISAASKATDLLPKKSVTDATLDEIRVCLKDEVDYVKEAENTRWFRENMKVVNVKIPQVYDDFSSDRVLTTEFVQGLHLDGWLSTNPSQDLRNTVGQTIFNIFMVSTFELRALHADPHPGNYLFLESGDVALLDFGCIKHLKESFTHSIEELVKAILSGNQELVLQAYKELGLFSERLLFDDYIEQVYTTLAPIQQWMAEPFRESEYDFNKLPPLPKTHLDSHKATVSQLQAVQRDQMYFDRTYVGVYLLLKKIGAVIETENPWLYRPH